MNTPTELTMTAELHALTDDQMLVVAGGTITIAPNSPIRFGPPPPRPWLPEALPLPRPNPWVNLYLPGRG